MVKGEGGDIMSENIMLFPDFERLRKQVDKLRTELSMLVLERDELQYMECPNIEMAYMLELGALEYKAYEAQCSVLRLKRKLEIIQARRNRQERIVLVQIEKTLDAEFSEYQKKLNAQIDKMNTAIERSHYGILSDEETREIKKLYRRIVKALHPDLHLVLSESQKRLFENAVNAYKKGDLNTLHIIDEMISESVLPDDEQDAMVQLAREKEHLATLLQSVRDDIAKIKSNFPYTMKKLLQNPEKLADYKTKLTDIMHQYEDMIAIYSQKIKEILEG